MTREEIMVLDAEQIDARSAELASEIEIAETNEAMDAIQEELEAIEERKATIKLEVEQRKMDMSAVIHGEGEVLEEVKDERKVTTMEVTMLIPMIIGERMSPKKKMATIKMNRKPNVKFSCKFEMV